MESQEVRNPFALLIDPEVVVKAVESSQRLARLRSRICRPLDRPLDQPPGSALSDDDDGSAAGAEADPEPQPQA